MKNKILMPYSTHFDAKVDDSHGKVITGGIEKFCFDLETNFEEIIPLCISKKDKENRNTKSIIQDAINKHNPDFILFHNPWWSKMMMSFNVRLICVMHEPLVRDIRMVELGTLLKKLQENHCHLYFVSPAQLQYHRDMAKRIKKVDFGEIKGFIRPSFLQENLQLSDELIYDCVTVGRSDNEKAPFLVHEKLKDSPLVSLVMTNEGVYKSDAINLYQEKNKQWKYPRETFRGLSHSEVMTNISKAKVFVSTWDKESWGITAMEALGCGVPTILFTDESGNHASEIVAQSPDHIFKISRKCSSSEFEELVVSIINTHDAEKRKEISKKTIQKHGIESWKQHIQDIFDERMNDTNGRNSLEHLFD